MAGRPLRRARLAAQAAQGSRVLPTVAPAPNSRTVNRAIAEAGIPVTLYKGKGYFYYEAADKMLDLESTYVCYWDDLTLDEWVDEVRHKYEAALRRNLGGWRTRNPHSEAYYNHPSVKDHVAVRITAKGRDALAKRRGTPTALRLLTLLADGHSLPQFVVEGEFGIGHAVLSSLLEAGLISAAIETKPSRSYAPEYTDDDFNLEYQHREMLRRRR